MNRIWIGSGSGMHLKFAISMVALLFALSVSAQAQQPGKIFRIGVLDNTTASGIAVRRSRSGRR